jgi:hypothetical protein
MVTEAGRTALHRLPPDAIWQLAKTGQLNPGPGTRDVLVCCCNDLLASGAALEPAGGKAPTTVDRGVLWHRWAAAALSGEGSFGKRYRPCNGHVTDGERLRFVVAASNLLRNLSSEPPPDGQSPAELRELLGDCAWLIGKHAGLSFGVPPALGIEECLRSYIIPCGDSPAKWEFALGQFFHAVDVWLLGDLVLELRLQSPGSRTVAEELASEVGLDAESLRAQHLVASIFHDVSRVAGYTTGQQLVGHGAHAEQSAANLSEKLSHLGPLAPDFSQASDAIRLHAGIAGEVPYVSYPLAAIFMAVDGALPPDADEEDPFAKATVVSRPYRLEARSDGSSRSPLSFQGLLRGHCIVEQVTIGGETDGGTGGKLPTLTLEILHRTPDQRPFTPQFNWLAATMEWQRLRLGGMPFELSITFRHPHDRTALSGGRTKMQELSDYAASRPNARLHRFLDCNRTAEQAAQAISYSSGGDPLEETLTCDLARLGRDPVLPPDLSIDWQDFAAWCLLSEAWPNLETPTS